MDKTVLIIDDEPDLIEIVKSHVEDAGYLVQTARDGTEGLKMARTINPDLIILDIGMPGMTGLEMLEKLRQTPGLQSTPVLMLSAQGQSTNIFEADRLRAADFLIKPFTREELILAVQQTIR